MTSPARRRIVSFVVAAALLGALLASFSPIWTTSDDVLNSMTAHGYGISPEPSPSLIYSNVLLGRLVSSLPPIGGVFAYSWLTLGAVLACSWIVLDSLVSLGAGWPLSILATVFLMARPAAFPHFTTLSGMLAVAGVLALLRALRYPSRLGWTSPVLLLFASFLVRSDEFAFILVVSAPMLPWRELRRDPAARLAGAAFAALLAVAAVSDRIHYSGDEWRAFNAYEPVRVVLTDYNVEDSVLARPDLLSRHGYSQNDFLLLGRWFSVDATLADPARLRPLLAEVDLRDVLSRNRSNVAEGIRSVLSGPSRHLVLAAPLMGLLASRRRRVGWAWLLFLLVLLATGLAGRAPAAFPRVFLPAAALLYAAPLALGLLPGSRWPRMGALAVTAVLGGFSLASLAAQARATAVASAQVRSSLRDIPADRLHVVWGGGFPLPLAYPVLLDERDARRLRFVVLNPWFLTPMERRQAEAWGKDGFRQQLQEGSVSLFAQPQWLPMLDTYCKEHLGRGLTLLREYRSTGFRRLEVTCSDPTKRTPGTLADGTRGLPPTAP